jgi:hypothetical protein
MLDLHRLVEILSLNKMNDYGGTKHTGVPVKTLKKLLKKAGLKVSGKKATLTRRAKKARLMKGGGFFDNFRYASPEASKKATTINLRPQSRSMMGNIISAKAIFENSPEQKAARAEREKNKAESEAAIKGATEAQNEQIRREFQSEYGYSIDDVKEPDMVKDFFWGVLVGSTPRPSTPRPRGGKNKRSRRS